MFMQDALDDLTVAQLKDLLRDRDLPVSGNKSELIERLRSSEPSKVSASENEGDGASMQGVKISERKTKFRCRVCNALLAVPSDYNGDVECPTCKARQPVRSTEASVSVFNVNLTQNQVSLGLSISGVIVGILAIVVFFSGFTAEAWCPEEDRTTVVENGEEYYTCNSDEFLWETTAAKRFFWACCLFAPLSGALTASGLGYRKPAVELTQQTMLTPSEQKNDAPYMASEARFSDSPTAAWLQSLARWFGVGVSTAATIVTLVVIAFFTLAIFVILNSDGFFA